MALRRSRRRAWASAWAAAVIAACEAGGGTGPGSITEADFAILDWVLVPSASGAPAVHVTAVDGRAGAGEVSYTVLPGEAVFSDANGDDRLDALVPVQSSDGERQWYLWADVEGGPRQVPLPVAHSRSCGTVTTAVAGVEGGFEIREVRRRIDEFDLPCHAPGLDGRVRTVGFADFDGELWPVQIEPFRAFGGICPVAVEYDAYPVEVTLYAAPAPGAAMEFREPSYVAEWMVEDWPVYTEGYPEWLLVGVIADGDLGCAWGKRAGT